MRVFSLLSFHLFVRMKQQAWQKVDRKRDGQKTRLHIKNAFKYICWDAGSFVLFQSTSACVGTKIWYLRIYPFCLIFFLFFCSRFISISSSLDVNVEFDFSFHSRRALKNHFMLLDFICFSLNIFCCFVFKNQRFPSIKESSRPMNVIDQANPWL